MPFLVTGTLIERHAAKLFTSSIGMFLTASCRTCTDEVRKLEWEVRNFEEFKRDSAKVNGYLCKFTYKTH